MGKSVLLISYTFPPAPGIGGRRWAKFAKYLALKDVDVYVISAENACAEISAWQADTASAGINKYLIPAKYPAILSEMPRTLLQRLQYKLALAKVKKKTKGSIYDRGALSEQDILDTASRLIEENKIDRVICTGAPFSILYYGVLLKKKYPHIRLMGDMRDPWTWGIGYGFGQMEEKRMAYEQALEKEVMEASDLVTVPVQPMLVHLQNSYPQHAAKMIQLSHGIDTDDIPVEQSPPAITHTVKLIYSGTIYAGVEDILDSFSILLLQQENKFLFNIYTLSKKKALHDQFNRSPIQIHSPVPSTDLFTIIQQHDFYVSFVTEQYKDFISTKYFEIIYLRKPILLISPKGELSEFILKNKLGLHFLPGELDKLLAFLNKPSGLAYNTDFKLDDVLYDRLADSVLENFINK